jgi:choline-sulfatase
MRPTNLLVLMADEHTKRVLGCYGNPVVQTPNLDALARDGTRFADAYCTFPICVPSRASFATGRYAHDIGSWDNAAPYVGVEAPSWGHRLAENGRHVTTVGKLHYRAAGDPSGFADQRLPLHVVDGRGDSLGLLRGAMPPTPAHRRFIEEAGEGESEYARYDRAIAAESARWLREEARTQDEPWVLFVSFASPHFPLIAPPLHYRKYPPADVPLPVAWRPEQWVRHRALDVQRRLHCHDQPFDEATLRRAVAAYYGLVSFVDEQIGIVLSAIEETGLRGDTRIVYTSDHGEALGERGMWMKGTMYEGVAGVPLIVAGPDVPRGRTSGSFASLVDVFPSALECTGVPADPRDARLPGRSLWRLAEGDDRSRSIFAEYHAAYSPSAIFLLRDADIKFVYYVDDEPQLFDLARDPDELDDRARDPAYAGARASCEAKLRAIVDPEAVDRAAKADQARRIAERGGADAIRAEGVRIPYTPAPKEFDPGGVSRS